jgi:hypothetical protein
MTPIIDELAEVSKVSIVLDKIENCVTISEQCDGYYPIATLDKEQLGFFIQELQLYYLELK